MTDHEIITTSSTLKQNDSLPKFCDHDGRLWGVVEMHICIDFGGRQVEIMGQRQSPATGKFVTKNFTAYMLPENRNDSSIPVEQPLFRCLVALFTEFDVSDMMSGNVTLADLQSAV